MSQLTTLIFASSKADSIWALNYSHSHRQEKVKLFPTDVPALLHLLRTHPKVINRLDTFIKPSQKLRLAVTLPLKITQQIISIHPHLQLWVDVFRSQLVKALSHYYILHRLTTKTSCRKVIVSPVSLYLPAVRQFARDYHLTFQVIPQTPTPFSSQLQHHLSLYLEPIRWFLAHPQELSPFILSFLPAPSPSRAEVLIFSNGLNLASYHTTIKALSKLVTIKIVTDKQNFKDRLYLAKYSISGQQLSTRHLFKAPLINSKITLTHIKSTPWFIRQSSLRHLSQEIISQTVKASGAKILAKKQQAQHLIAQVQPKLVITTHDPGPSGLSFVTAAQTQKITTLLLLHGSPSLVHFFYSDFQLIWGSIMKRWLIQIGLPPSKLKLGGHPIYVDYKRYFNHHQSKSWPITIGILTTGDGNYEWHQPLYFWDLFCHLRSLRHCRFLIRTHGMQHLRPVAQLARHFELKVSLTPHFI